MLLNLYIYVMGILSPNKGVLAHQIELTAHYTKASSLCRALLSTL